jgi:hypothetical protein
VAAGGHVGAAEIEGDRQVEALGDAARVDQLHGAANRRLRSRRLVQHGLAVHADEIQALGRHSGGREEFACGEQMLIGDGAGGPPEYQRGGRAARP